MRLIDQDKAAVDEADAAVKAFAAAAGEVEDGRPGFALERHDRDRIVGGDLVLFAAGANDCEHRFLRVHPGSARKVRAAGFFAACNLLF